MCHARHKAVAFFNLAFKLGVDLRLLTSIKKKIIPKDPNPNLQNNVAKNHFQLDDQKFKCTQESAVLNFDSFEFKKE